MYVLQEYLISLALVSLLGLVLFGVAVIGLVGKSGADWLAASAAKRLPRIATHLPPRTLEGFAKNHRGPIAQS